MNTALRKRALLSPVPVRLVLEDESKRSFMKLAVVVLSLQLGGIT